MIRTTRLDNAGNIQSRVMTRGSDTLQYDSYFWNTTAEYYTVLHPYVAMTDHLGSLTGLYDHNGYKTLDATYDAWGKRTFAAGSM